MHNNEGGNMLINKTQVRELVGTMSLSKDFCDALDAHTKDVVEKAIKRARANNRNTLMPRDL